LDGEEDEDEEEDDEADEEAEEVDPYEDDKFKLSVVENEAVPSGP